MKMTREIWDNSEIFSPIGCPYRILLYKSNTGIHKIYVSNGIPKNNKCSIFEITYEKPIGKRFKIPRVDIIKILKFLNMVKEEIEGFFNDKITPRKLYEINKVYNWYDWDNL